MPMMSYKMNANVTERQNEIRGEEIERPEKDGKTEGERSQREIMIIWMILRSI